MRRGRSGILYCGGRSRQNDGGNSNIQHPTSPIHPPPYVGGYTPCGSLAAVSSSFPALAAEHDGPRTNWIENTITNVIEVRIARNRFVNEYRTNWLEHVSTNVFDIYKTNQLTRTVTNRLIVDAWRTNFVDSYQTNWKSLHLTNDIVLTRFQTNFVDAFRTNWKHLTLTNEVAINRVRTSVVDAVTTNWQTLSFTNWQTVVVMKTNWVSQFVTNVVQRDLPKSVSVTQAAPEKSATFTARTGPSPSNASEDPVIEVSRTSKPPGNGLVEIELKIRWPSDTVDAPPVQQWRIERGDGVFLSFGQDQEFKKELPVGNYTVQARLQRDAESPSFLLRGTLTVTIKEAIVQQRTDRTKIAAVSEHP